MQKNGDQFGLTFNCRTLLPIPHLFRPAMLPLFILQTGNPPQAIRERHGSFADMFGALLAPLGRRVVVARGYAGEALPDAAGLSGAVITGSPGNITDAAPWMREAADWVRGAHAAGLPLFGVCFGHQLMAHALGGRVDYHPGGREVGSQAIQLSAAAGSDPWLDGVPATFPAQLLHEQLEQQGYKLQRETGRALYGGKAVYVCAGCRQGQQREILSLLLPCGREGERRL